MASRASAVLALAALGAAVAAFAVVEGLVGSWACAVGCSSASGAAVVEVLVALGTVALVVGGVAAAAWLRSTAPRRRR